MYLLSNSSRTPVAARLKSPIFPTDDGSTKFEPDRAQWSALVRSTSTPPAAALGLTSDEVVLFRRELLSAARHWTHRLQLIAEKHQLPAFELPASIDGHVEPRIVGTGHQPHVFHSGTIFKYDIAAQFATERRGVALSIVMDTDRGDAGRFAFPRAIDTGVAQVSSLEFATLATPASLFDNGYILPVTELTQVRHRVGRQLELLGKHAAFESFSAAMDVFTALAGQKVTEAQSIARRCLGRATQTWELPLTYLCQRAGFRQGLMHVMRDAAAFHACYNETLDEWRTRRRIRNGLNPFPRLKQRERRYELPIWAINLRNDERLAIWVEPERHRVRLFAGSQEIGLLTPDSVEWPEEAQGFLIAPRAALISMMFRTLCCDFFLHGLRGRSYDGFTDRLIANYCHMRTPQFAVASMSRLLFPDEFRRSQQAAAWHQEARYWAHHPECLLLDVELPPQDRDALAKIVGRKAELLRSIAERSGTARPTRHEHSLLQGLRRAVASILETQQAASHSLNWSPAAMEAIRYRTYPWFFHCDSRS